MDDAMHEEWPLEPTSDEVRAGAGEVARLFGAGLAGGALTVVGLAFLATPTHTCGATRTLQLDRERRALCMELGVTPEELAALEAAGEVTVAATSASGGGSRPRD